MIAKKLAELCSLVNVLTLAGCDLALRPSHFSISLTSPPPSAEGARSGPLFTAIPCVLFSFSGPVPDSVTAADVGVPLDCAGTKGILAFGTREAATNGGLTATLPFGSYTGTALGVTSTVGCADLKAVLATRPGIFTYGSTSLTVKSGGNAQIINAYNAATANDRLTACTSTSHLRAFVTPQAYPGNMGGGAGMTPDVVCTIAATQAGMQGTWKAVVSTAAAARDRLNISSPIYNLRPDSQGGPQLVAVDSTDLWSGNLHAPINWTPAGVVANNIVWSGTSVNGNRDALNCANWTNGTDSDAGTGGFTNRIISKWIVGGLATTCDIPHPLYCLEQIAREP